MTETAAPMRNRDVANMGRRSADEVVVVIKLEVDEDAVMLSGDKTFSK